MAGSVTVKELCDYLTKNYDPALAVEVGSGLVDLSSIEVTQRGRIKISSMEGQSANQLLQD